MRIAPLLLLVLLGLAACGGDDQTPAEAARDDVCDVRGDIRDGLDEVATDIRAGNVGEAQEEVADVREDIAELTTAVGSLAQEQRAAVQPQLDAISEALGAISLDDLGSLEAAVETVRA